MRKEVRQWSDRKKKLDVPFFPNYVFVKTRKADRYKVFDVPGIVRFLDSNENPTIMADHEIEMIRQVQMGGNVEVTNDSFIKGDAVMITSGPLTNLRGVLIDRKGNKRLLLEIQSIKRSLLIDVAPYQLKKVPEVTSALPASNYAPQVMPTVPSRNTFRI